MASRCCACSASITCIIRPLLARAQTPQGLLQDETVRLLLNLRDVGWMVRSSRIDDDVSVTFADEFEAGAYERARKLLYEASIDETCPVCLETVDVLSLDRIYVTPCKHVLHGACMARVWPSRLFTACAMHCDASQEELLELRKSQTCIVCFSRIFPFFRCCKRCPVCQAEIHRGWMEIPMEST